VCSSSGVAGTFIAGEVAPRDLDLVTVDSVVARMPQFHLANHVSPRNGMSRPNARMVAQSLGPTAA